MDYQSYLSQKYQGHESFLENIIFPIFGEDNYESAWDVELLDSEELRGQAAKTGIRSIIRCGTINLDLTPIEVFDITVSDRLMMEKNRVGVQAVIRRVMDTYSGSFMLIHYDNDTKWDWRFTFCQLKDKNEFTDSKRYTFLLGPSQSCRTAAQNFQKLADLNQIITIKDIQTAFDVEALSKEFFGKYKNHYERFVEYITGKRFVKEGGKFVEKTNHEPHPVYYAAFGNKDKAVRDYVKLTLGRIILMHFVQKKGWLGVPVGEKWGNGDEQFMRNLFVKASAEQKDDFLESVLEPLFFDAIDTDRRDSGDIFDTKVVGKVRIPYLNGGLFEKNKEDEVIVRFPAEFFSDLLEFFSEYNFTIDENDPNEAQVGIDPEMLSQIFENLLEDNKDKGAFYTPKEIVKYMCQESLIAYLNTKTGYEEEKLRKFVHNPDIVVAELSESEKDLLLDAILSVKICDPAIGSGAFPIGLLNELVRCKEAIFGDKKGRADIKREIIRDNIYGVDIEKGAVDIARLRFWLSLVVDEEEPSPLPNLDFKIMQGNSLLEQYNGVDLSHLLDEQEGTITWGEEIDFKQRLSKLLKLYFDSDEHTIKNDLKVEISELIKEKLNEYSHRGRYGENSLNMSNINIEANSQFFLWHTWFADVFNSGGFDIFIANPPYIKEDFNSTAFIGFRDSSPYYMGKMDLWYGFCCHGIDLLKQSGHLCFIAQNNWTTNAGAKKLRNKILSDTKICIMIDFDKYMVFGDSASIQTMIMLFKKEKYENTYVFDYRKLFLEQPCKKDALRILNKDRSVCDLLTPTINYNIQVNRLLTFASDKRDTLLNKISHNAHYLNSNEATNGIHSHFDFVNKKMHDKNSSLVIGSGIFGLSSQELNDLNLPEEEKGLIKPYYFSEQTLRYVTNINNQYWIIYTDSKFKNPETITKYPTIKKHLDRYQEVITSDNRPYGLHRSREERFFRGEKIASLRMCSGKPCFSYSSFDCYLSAAYYIIKTERFDMKFLTGLFNSKLMEFWLKLRGKVKGDVLQIDKEPIMMMPIKTDGENDRQISQLFEQILKIKQNDPLADISEIEHEIDKYVYKLYNLNDSEVSLIEGISSLNTD